MEDPNNLVLEEFVEIIEVFSDIENGIVKADRNSNIENTRITEYDNRCEDDANVVADLDEREASVDERNLERAIEEKLNAIRGNVENELPRDPRIEKPKTKLPILLKRIEPYRIEVPRVNVQRRSVFERLGRLDFISMIRRTGRDLVVKYGSIDPCRGLAIMVHIGVGFEENLIGERAASWVENSSSGSAFVGCPKTIEGDLDGAPFMVLNARRAVEFEWYQAPDLYAKRVQVKAIVVPSRGHTPDFAPERLEFGRDFIRRHILDLDLIRKTLIIRSDENQSFTCDFEYRVRSRRYR